MKEEYKKSGKGWNVYLNGKLIMWVIGSKNNAKKELQKYLKKN